ncbi:MAG: carotenoid biosynthesis protein [Candidatus Nanopelagicales bacterium]
MSIRVYRGPHRDTGGPTFGFRTIPWIFFGLGLLFSALWPIFPQDRQYSLSLFLILFLFIATTAHAFIWWGMAWAATFLVVSLGLSFSFLAINSATGFIFGDVQYTYRLGIQLFHVPFSSPLIWSSVSYLGIVLSRRITRAVIMSPLTAAFISLGLLLVVESLFANAGYFQWLPKPENYSILGINPVQFQIVSFFILLSIMLLSSQNAKNDRYSTKFPYLTYMWIFLFAVYCAQFLSNNISAFLIPFLIMAYSIVIFAYKTIRER